jgi:hypothetical protein
MLPPGPEPLTIRTINGLFARVVNGRLLMRLRPPPAQRDLVQRAERDSWTYRDFLTLLVTEEIAHRLTASKKWRPWTGRSKTWVNLTSSRPQSGFAVHISRISARTSCGTVGRPVRSRLFQVQNKRKPRQCPGDDGRWLNDIEGRVPTASSVRQPCPEDTIHGRQPRAWPPGTVHDR